jgi:hypothetical protein
MSLDLTSCYNNFLQTEMNSCVLLNLLMFILEVTPVLAWRFSKFKVWLYVTQTLRRKFEGGTPLLAMFFQNFGLGILSLKL